MKHTPICPNQHEARFASWFYRKARAFAVMTILGLSLTIRASLVTQYWPMNDGDIRYFSGFDGSSYCEMLDQFDYFSMDIYTDASSSGDYSYDGSAWYAYSDSLDALFNTGQSALGYDLYFDPLWQILDDDLLADGGSKSATFTGTIPDITNVTVHATVSVKLLGAVTVPAGTFQNCRQVNFSLKVFGLNAGGQAFVIAPRVGMIKLGLGSVNGSVAGWQSLTSGTVGGVDVRNLTGVIGDTLTVTKVGNGTITPDLNGTFQEIGSSQTLTATPMPGNVFVGWTGSITTNSPKLTFNMASNMVLQANFATNSIIPLAGVYSGLFYDLNAVEQASSGSFAATVKTTKTGGAYSAKFQFASGAATLSGVLDVNGRARGMITPKQGPECLVDLQLDLNPSNAQLFGTISNENWSAYLRADRAIFSAANRCPYAAKATIVFPGSPNGTDPAAPEGDSVGTLTIDPSGKIKFVGSLSDNTPFTQSTIISKDGDWPAYMALYKGLGSFIGWLSLTNAPEFGITGLTSWIKASAAGGNYYPQGFSNQVTAIGAIYHPPAANTPVISMTNGNVILLGTNPPAPLTNGITLTTANTIQNNDASNKLTMKITAKTGAFTGSVTLAGAKKAVPFKGVLLQNQNIGRGFYLSTNSNSGAVLTEP